MHQPGWGEKVTAHTEPWPERRVWLHIGTYGYAQWISEDSYACNWDDLRDPVLYDQAPLR